LIAFYLSNAPIRANQRRLLLGAAARALGYGGVSRVARLAEASRPTVGRGAGELDQPADPRGRVRLRVRQQTLVWSQTAIGGAGSLAVLLAAGRTGRGG